MSAPAPATRTSRKARPRRLGSWPVGWVLALLVGLLVGLALLPLARAWLLGNAARDSLVAVKVALQDGDEDAARAAVAEARDQVHDFRTIVDSPVGDAWGRVPGFGTALTDGRRFGAALADVVAVAGSGLELWPEMAGEESQLFDGKQVDLALLERVIDEADDVVTRLDRARESLEAVRGDGVVLGDAVADARDDALAELVPLDDAAEDLRPLLPRLPAMLGAEGPRRYVIAILNPAELLYSGGTPLSFAPLTVDDGRIEMGETVDTADNGEDFVPRFWKKVEGNPFHRGRLRVATATMAPSWPVAGEELLNAWRSLYGVQGAGVIAVDVMTLARLAEITGPMAVEGYGTVDAANLAHILIGNYDNIPNPYIRHTINASLVPLFHERLFDGGQLAAKARVLHEMAQGRHFAVFFRDDDVQAAFDRLGVTGDLSDTDHDYLGVFTQNAVPSKTDYYQSRTLRSRVRLAEDGSARVELEVDIHNDTPAYAFDGADPREGYFTRWLHASVGTFLPKGTEVRSASVDGVPFEYNVGDYFGRPFVRRTVVFAPQQRHTVRLVYDVPSAAVVEEDGGLTYGLDVDPQGMVRPQGIAVTVRFPAGHTPTDLPEGWVAKNARTAMWGGPALVASPRFELRATPTAPEVE
ncbi:DUF4012 domain-containing protein [Nocardioides gansuensis]|uniref:DUF4012 domain-containing protein n=1 Tax=Nocardioides gansuensis TaxID=2138300 RepID=UPI001057F7AE|nr:DUF4012 domain-containing protein [Nocardioides gansuensis]